MLFRSVAVTCEAKGCVTKDIDKSGDTMVKTLAVEVWSSMARVVFVTVTCEAGIERGAPLS